MQQFFVSCYQLVLNHKDLDIKEVVEGTPVGATLGAATMEVILITMGGEESEYGFKIKCKFYPKIMLSINN